MTSDTAIKSWIKQLNLNKDFIQIDNITNGNVFKPMYLVAKTTRKFIGRKTYNYKKTNIKLQELLLSGDHAAELEESPSFTLQNEKHGIGKGSLGVDVPEVTCEVGTSAHRSHRRNVTLKKRHISSKYLSFVHEDGKVKMNHPFIRQSKQFQRHLYVVTEALETVEATWCEESKGIKGGSFVKLPSFFKLGIQGGQKQKTATEIPKDIAVAYQVCKLYIGNGYVYISASEDRSDVGSFDAEITICTENGKPYKEIVLPPISLDSEPLLVGSTTNRLQREMKGHYEELILLPSHHCGQFLTGFVAIMKENDLLQKLMCQLEQALEGLDQFKLKTDCLELQELGKNLQDSRGNLITSLAEPVLYFLQALDELTEVHLLLLAESVKKGILSKQLALVKSILDGAMNFTVDAQLESQFAEEDLNITGAMIESSGVTLQREGPTLVGTRDSNTFLSLKALYVGLYILDRLYLRSKQHQPAQLSQHEQIRIQTVQRHGDISSHHLPCTRYSSAYVAWLCQRWPVHTRGLYSSIGWPWVPTGLPILEPQQILNPLIQRSMRGPSQNLRDTIRSVFW